MRLEIIRTNVNKLYSIVNVNFDGRTIDAGYKEFTPGKIINLEDEYYSGDKYHFVSYDVTVDEFSAESLGLSKTDIFYSKSVLNRVKPFVVVLSDIIMIIIYFDKRKKRKTEYDYYLLEKQIVK